MTSGNPILDNNLKCIERYNPKLKKDLLELPYLTHSIKLIETELKEPNLTFDGLALHAQSGAEIEAQNIFNDIYNSKISMHIVYGIGLGHLFKEFCERSKGVVFLYEPNLEILRVTLELVDFSKELSQPNVMVFSDVPTFKEKFVNSYQYKNEVTITALESYRNNFGKELDDTIKQMQIITGTCITDYNTVKKEGFNSIPMTLDNLIYTLEETPLNEFKDIYKGKTALIVSAGPSLDRNLEIIKKNRDKIIIFCVGTAYKALAKNGIKPDFLNIIEINDVSGQVKDFDLSDVNLILEPYTNTSIHKLKVKKKLLFASNTAHANKYWSNLTGVDISPYFGRGTVSYSAAYSAKLMGFKKIILVGQDLAYLNNKCYSDESAYSNLIFEVNSQTGNPEFKVKNQEKFIKSFLPNDKNSPIYKWIKENSEIFTEHRLKELNETLCFVRGISGEMLPTKAGYSTFIEHFREFAYLNKDLELINTSMIGAQIDGFKNMPLETALVTESTIEKLELSESYKYDKKKILENLEKDQKTLKDILQEFSKTEKNMYKFEREVKKAKTVTLDANKYFKNLLGLYDKITIQYYNSNPLFQILSFNEHIEVDYALRATEEVTIERIQIVYSFLKPYFQEIQKKASNIIEKIEQQKEIISESINSES